MIAKASAIQHGQAMTNYATKNNRADIVKTNHLSEGLPPMGMWDEMVLHQSMFKQRYAKKPIELTSIRFELSPSEEEARNWTMEDWRRFLDEFIREMDEPHRQEERQGCNFGQADQHSQLPIFCRPSP